MNLFQRLFGKKEKPALEPPPEFLQAAPPDWVIALRGADSDGAFSIRVQIFVGSRQGTADVVIMPEGAEPSSATLALERIEIDRSLVILGFSFPADFASVAGDTENADASELAVYRREPPGEAIAQCDLAPWLDSRKPGPPVVEISRVLLEIKHRAQPA